MSEVKETRYHHERRSIFWPLLLIAIGVMFLLDNTGFLRGNVWGLVIKFWPLLLIVGGLDGLWKSEGLAGSLFWMGVGFLFLFADLGYLSVNVLDMVLRFWPVLLIAVGVDLIIGRGAGRGRKFSRWCWRWGCWRVWCGMR